MSTLPINLNLALILHKLLIHQEGWSVEALMQELNISARTYRKYRKLLQDHLTPHFEEHQGARLSEQRRQDQMYLTLSPLPRSPGAHAKLLARLLMGGQEHETRVLRLDTPLEPHEHLEDVLYALLSRRTLELTRKQGSLIGDPLTLWSNGGHARLILRVSEQLQDIKLTSITTVDALSAHFVYPEDYDPDTYIASRDRVDDDE